MLKKLLVAIIALSFIFAMCSSAFAAKGTGQVKRLYQTLPNAPKTISDAQSCIPDQPPVGTKFPSAGQELTGMSAPSHKPASCDWYDYTCGLAYYWTIPDDYGDDFFNMRFSMSEAGAVCTLKTLEIVFYDISESAAGGVELYIWDDDGFGFPGTVIHTEVVTGANIVYYPLAVDVDVWAQEIIFNDEDYHFGYTTIDQANDVIACLSDDGSCGTMRSSELYGGVWGSMLNDWGVDVNFLMFVEACCGVPQGGSEECEWLDYTCGLAYYWSIPDAYGDDFFNMRFSASNPDAQYCDLETFEIAFYDVGDPYAGGVDIYVWTDAAGYPDVVVHTEHVAAGSIVFYPSIVSVDLTTAGLQFSGDYHCGYSTTDQVNDIISCLSDDGSCGTMRSSEFYGGAWGLMIDDWGVDVNFLMFAYHCCFIPESEQNCYNIDYAGPGWYFWTIPDAYGDDFFNMRFAGGDACTVLTLNLAFYQAASVGSPGAEVYVWNSDGVFPTGVVTTIPIDPVAVWYPGFESLDVSGAGIIFGSSLHVGYTPIYNDPGDVLAIISDDGFSGTGVMQSSEMWAGIWGLMVDDWGIDVNFLINMDVCCPPADYCHTTCNDDDQWPTFAHDYARTSQSGVTVGDLCGLTCAWNFYGTSTIDFASPTIADDMVFAAFGNELVVLALADGSVVWRSSAHGDWAGLISGTRTCPTYEAGYIYASAGNSKGFVKADAVTGNIVWSRSLLGNPLPGSPSATRFCPSVIIGNEIYFGDDGGQIYALDKMTGADIDYASLNFGVFTSPSYADDANMLLFGTSATTAGGGGGVYGVTPPMGGTFTQVWYWENPAQGTVYGGTTSAPSYKCGYAFVGQSYPYGNFSVWAGTRHALDPASGADLWPDIFLMGSHLYAPPAVIGWVGSVKTRIYFANEITNSAGTAFGSGVRAVDIDNSTIWLNSGSDAYSNKVTNHATVTCDPYVIYGTRNTDTQGGSLFITNWDDGSLVAQYNFTGYVLGSAVARHSVNGLPYIVTFVRHTNYLAGPGGVFAFTDDGVPKPKMVVPELFVDLGMVTEDGVVSHADAVTNAGCASLSGSAVISSSNPVLSSRPTDVHPQLIRTAELAAGQVIDFAIDDYAASVRKSAVHDLTMRVEDDVIIRDAVKPTAPRSSSLASSWAAFANGTENFGLAQGVGHQFDFDITIATMFKLLPSTFYVEIMSNDPCYVPEDPAADPQETITYQATYGYCAPQSGTMYFGTEGEEYYTNWLDFGDADVPNGFALHGGTGALFDGTNFFMTSMDDAAWTPATGGGGQAPTGFTYFYPFFIDGVADCGGCEFGIPFTQVEYTTDGGANYANPVGDLCHFAAIDSLQGNSGALWPGEHQAGPSIGINVNYREVGTYTIAGFPEFDYFKLVVFDIYNRNATPITGLYYGNLSDWDVQDYGDNKVDGDAVNGLVYCWDVDDPDYYGQIGLPRTGGYWPDLTPTDGYYNSRSSHNPTESYNDTALDELFNYIDGCPENTHCYGPGAAPADPPDDASSYITFGKSDIPGMGVVSFGMAVFGLELPASPVADMADLSVFVNKYSGHGRGDVNNDGVFDLKDLVYLSKFVADGLNGPVPFMHLGDVNADGAVDLLDVEYMEQFFFYYGPPPVGTFVF